MAIDALFTISFAIINMDNNTMKKITLSIKSYLKTLNSYTDICYWGMVTPDKIFDVRR